MLMHMVLKSGGIDRWSMYYQKENFNISSTWYPRGMVPLLLFIPFSNQEGGLDMGI